MNVMQKIIYAGFAALALASASMPVFSSPEPIAFVDETAMPEDFAPDSSRR